MTKTELSWIAGFYEGEGYFGVTHKVCYSKGGKKYVYKYRVLKGCVSQKYRHVLSWIRRKLGFGSVHFQKNRRSSFGSSLWTLYFSHKKAEKFATLILPYMRAPHKIRQMQRALSLWRKYK